MRALRTTVLALALLVATSGTAQAAGRCGPHPWCDTALSPERRAALLVEALTPEERIGLLAGDEAGGVVGRAGTHTGTEDGVPRLGVPALYLTDGSAGVRSGPGTALPAPIAMAAAFDRRLAGAYGRVVANEAKLKGNDVIYAPAINLLRTPLSGRGFETFGEDPFLTARLGVAWIRAAQAEGVIANVKHYAVNNQEGAPGPGNTTLGERYRVDVRVGERVLREMYLPHFEAAVREARAGSVMCAYNRVNGRHACESRELLDRILRREWGFRGFVLADYGASKRVGTGLAAGLDFEPWPFVDFNGGENLTPARVREALAAGRTTQAAVDRAVRRIMRTLFAYGFFDRAAYVYDDTRVDRRAHARTSQAVAEAGMVLLENRGVLPLRASKLRSLAVIGADADSFKTGGGSSKVEPYNLVTPRQGIAARAGPGVRVRFDTGHDLARAAASARGADAAVVVVGDVASEFQDRPCLRLSCGQKDRLDRDALIRRVAAANPRTVVVLETSGPVLMPWRHRVEAIVQAWYPGDRGGSAIARVLFGDVDPGGRLPATFPRRAQDLPTAGNPRRYPGVDDVVHYSEGLLVGYRWHDRRRVPPAYPFGHGLSYTRFSISDLRARPLGRGTAVRVSAEVANRGRRRGSTVAQLYMGLPGARGRPQPPRQLKGFAKLALRPGRAKRARFTLDARAFAHWDSRRDRWAIARGCYRLWAGESSRDLGEEVRIAVGGARCRGAALALPRQRRVALKGP